MFVLDESLLSLKVLSHSNISLLLHLQGLISTEGDPMRLWQRWRAQRRLILTLMLITLFNGALTLLFSRLTQLDLPLWLNQYQLLPVAPLVGGLLLWWLHFRFQGHTRVGLTRVAIGYHFDKLPISWLDISYQFFGALIAVLSGFAVGIVGPAIYLSGWLASRFAEKANFDWQQQRMALACGSATAIAVLFASPFGALVLVTETIIRRWQLKTSLFILGCGLIAAALGVLIGGSVLKLYLPRLNITFSELPWFILLGLLAALSVWGIQQIMRFWPIKVSWHGLLVTAICTAVAGLWEPELLGLEAVTPAELLAWQQQDQHLWIWFALRTLLTAMALAVFIPGGSFGPALVIGGLLGASLATLIDAPIQPLLIVAGMAAVLTVVLHAPLAATLLMMEHCQQWSLLVPTLTACLTASLSLKYILRCPSLLDYQLQQQGICLLYSKTKH